MELRRWRAYGISPDELEHRREHLAAMRPIESDERSSLRGTDEQVDIIAERVGYADVTHFIRLFRRANGLTPAAWRRQAAHRAQ